MWVDMKTKLCVFLCTVALTAFIVRYKTQNLIDTSNSNNQSVVRLQSITLQNGHKQKLNEIFSSLKSIDGKDSIVYLIQGPANKAALWKERINALGKQAYHFYHSYDKPCNHCIYQNGTTVPGGINLLLKHALLHPKMKTFKYYAYFDFDLVLKCSSGSSSQECWVKWHRMLLEPSTNWPQISPQTWHDPVEDTKMQSCMDPAIVIAHHLYVHLAFPVVTHSARRGYWYFTHTRCSINNRCLPLSILVDSRWRISNPTHSDYVGLDKSVSIESVVHEMLESDYKELGPWDKEPIYYHHKLVGDKITKTWKMDSKCDSILRTRFTDWFNKDHVPQN